jgi:Zn-dependent protease
VFDHVSVPTILISYVALLFSLCVHEASHATAAYWLEDDTAARLGRMTLNPLAHMDPIGTFLFPLLGMFTGLPFIGWAKPVPVDGRKLTRRFSMRAGFAMVASAGPISNLIQAVVFFPVLALLVRASAPDVYSRVRIFEVAAFDWSSGVVDTLKAGGLSNFQTLFLALLGRLVMINLLLALFNLLPLGPLDGAGILRGIVPSSWTPKLDRYQPYMFILILVLAFSGMLGYIISPALSLAYFMLTPLANFILGA